MIQSIERLHIVVKGEVQGIGYRWFVQRAAHSLGITGWVKNLFNGDVELEVDGEKATLDEFVDRLRKGHTGAVVERIDLERRSAGQNPYTDFEIHY